MWYNSFTNAQEAFEKFYETILEHGKQYIGKKAFFDIGFIIENPLDNTIETLGESEIKNMLIMNGMVLKRRSICCWY